ncbi:hypothetical protein Pan153_29700 [Gimesia panareensis]|uniref:Uncharacterized protein n=1 Tax=Gimesia panareensis TaxID=2527978 RepID=A0A518A1E2_9PLAN|nr:hypothetical protein Enr10x_08890 [Gimesia panareensis]QDU48537.1 hypothetical protein Pan110_08520 [Gimesia panareensis]QDV18313.1 hypothetical protein Pan153_29700 [Gimesia panareensis]
MAADYDRLARVICSVFDEYLTARRKLEIESILW